MKLELVGETSRGFSTRRTITSNRLNLKLLGHLASVLRCERAYLEENSWSHPHGARSASNLARKVDGTALTGGWLEGDHVH